MRWAVGVLVLLTLAACQPEADPGTASGQTVTPTPAPGWLWAISDLRVSTRDDLAYWVVTYDATWNGEGEPPEERCVFKVRNQEDIVVRQTGEVLEEGDDVEAETIYPDEVPGQPTTVSVDCEV